MFIDINTYLCIHTYVLDCKFMLYPPSMIAASCVAATIRGLRMTCPHITEHLHKITGIELVSAIGLSC